MHTGQERRSSTVPDAILGVGSAENPVRRGVELVTLATRRPSRTAARRGRRGQVGHNFVCVKIDVPFACLASFRRSRD
jgi:hypothetical protein